MEQRFFSLTALFFQLFNYCAKLPCEPPAEGHRHATWPPSAGIDSAAMPTRRKTRSPLQEKSLSLQQIYINKVYTKLKQDNGNNKAKKGI